MSSDPRKGPDPARGMSLDELTDRYLGLPAGTTSGKGGPEAQEARERLGLNRTPQQLAADQHLRLRALELAACWETDDADEVPKVAERFLAFLRGGEAQPVSPTPCSDEAALRLCLAEAADLRREVNDLRQNLAARASAMLDDALPELRDLRRRCEWAAAAMAKWPLAPEGVVAVLRGKLPVPEQAAQEPR